MVDVSGYSDYLANLEQLTHLKQSLSSEADAIRVRRQEASQRGTNLVRTAERGVDETRKSFRSLSDRVRSLATKYPDVVPQNSTLPSTLDQCTSMIRGVERELESIDAAESWLNRTHSRLSEMQPVGAPQMVAPAPAAQAPSSVLASPPSQTESRRGIAWYWWAGGAAGLAGIATALLTLL